VTDDRMRAERDLERAMDAATRRRADEEARVQRRFNGLKDVQELVSACEVTTVRALEKTMKERAEKVSAFLSEARKMQICVKTTLSGLDGLELEALKRTRLEIDKLMNEVSSRK